MFMFYVQFASFWLFIFPENFRDCVTSRRIPSNKYFQDSAGIRSNNFALVSLSYASEAAFFGSHLHSFAYVRLHSMVNYQIRLIERMGIKEKKL